MTKTESGNFHLGGLGCQEMDSTRSNVKEGTGGGGMEFGNEYQKPKNKRYLLI